MQRIIFMMMVMFVSMSAQAADLSGKEIIDRMVKALRGNSNISEYTMVVTTPQWKRDLTLKVWDDRVGKKSFVKILAPAKDAGTTFLRINYNLWMYMPTTEKVMKIPPSLMLQAWMGSDFTNDDLVKESSYTEDYSHVVEGSATTPEGDVYVVRLDPKPNAPVVWGKMICQVRKSDFMPVEHQYYSEGGKLMKRLHFHNYKNVSGHMYPMLWKMENVAKSGHFTTLTLKDIQFNSAIPAEIFSEQHLRK